MVRLGVFSPSVLLDLARPDLDAAGLEVEPIAVASSPAQFASLDAGEYDAVFTNPDNVLAYRRLPDNPLGRLLEVEIVAAIDRGLGLSLALRPGLDAPFAGMRFAVDVPNSGFAFVGYALLERAGLAPDDVDIATLGSTPRRAAALVAKECDATVLGAGNELVAEAAGARLVASASDLGPYLGTVLARRTATDRADEVDAIAAVLATTARRIVGGALVDEAAASAERLLGLDPVAARDHVAVLRDPRAGLVPDGVVDAAALETVIGLRRRFRPQRELDDATADAIAPAAR